MAAENNVVQFSDLPVKRPREEGQDGGENGVSATLSTLPNHSQHPGISAVMPGWFSEISPMWPG